MTQVMLAGYIGKVPLTMKIIRRFLEDKADTSQ
jgi:hypothetical protein